MLELNHLLGPLQESLDLLCAHVSHRHPICRYEALLVNAYPLCRAVAAGCTKEPWSSFVGLVGAVHNCVAESHHLGTCKSESSLAGRLA